MTCAAWIQLSPQLIIHKSRRTSVLNKGRLNGCNINLSSYSMQHDASSLHLLNSVCMPIRPVFSRFNVLVCRSVLLPMGGNETPIMKSAAVVLTRTYSALCERPIVLRLIPAVGVIAFAAWGLGPLMRLFRVVFFHGSDNSWKKSGTHYIMSSYLQPLLLWTGATLICRALDPLVLPLEASQAVKQRLLNFVQSLSTVLAFAYCLSGLIQQAQNFFREMSNSSDTRNMGFDFAGKAVYTLVWIAAVSLFMELLGFSTQKWLTAGGLGTVLITLAGREIFTNFLSSAMIHVTRPFVVNEWIQTKIEGYEVSGTVEHVGWWSPTIIRGDDREAVHIPNHKFTVNVVRNLSQKTHWRIKTHLAISHLDVNKINNIVADMRKVLAKNPQVEQQKLHRRVFLENVDPENQALMILVSCFVKTSHFEEYLRVKEVILLDLLRVISHHRARLATPIRRVQNIYSEADFEEVPIADTIFTRGRASNRPLLLIEPAYKIHGDDKVKASTRSAQKNEEKDSKVEAVSTSDLKANTESGSVVVLKEDTVTALSIPNSSSSSEVPPSDPLSSNVLVLENSIQNNSKKQSKRSKEEITSGVGAMSDDSPVTKTQSSNEKSENLSAVPQAKQDVEKSPASPPVTKPSLEDNIVLGVALEGSKRTLPVDEVTTPKDGQMPLVPGATRNDKKDKER
ncbi:hypothetical protein SLA2020_333660 [Shorea laevis]